MKGNEIVELSKDALKMRPLVDPTKWPLEGQSITFSNLNVDVPEFVPGKAFFSPTPATTQQESGMKTQLYFSQNHIS